MANERLTYVTDLLVGKNDTSKAVSGLENQIEGVGKAASNIGASFSKSFGAVAIGASIAAIAYKGLSLAIEGVRLAAVTEENVTKLNNALKSTGTFTKEASKELLDFATQMQRTTKFSDDSIISALSFLRSLTKLSNEGLVRTTRAAADLASATGKDLQTVMETLAKAANGNTGTLSRMGIAFKGTGNAAKDFERVLTLIEGKVGGRAQADAISYSGALTILNASYEDLLKSFGNAVIKSPSVIALFQATAGTLDEQTDSISKAVEGVDLFEDSLRMLSATISAVFVPTVAVIEVWYNVFKTALLNLGLALETFWTNLITLGPRLAKFLGKDVGKEMDDLINKADKLGNAFGNALDPDKILDTSIADRLDKFTRDFEERLAKLRTKKIKIDDIDNGGKDDAENAEKGAKSSGGEEFSLGFGNELERIRVILNQVGSAILGGLSQGADGAKSAVASSIGGISEFFAPGSGPFAQQLASLLMMNEDQLRETLDAFFKAIPSIISNIITNLPVLIEAIVLGLTDALIVLTEKMDVIAEKFIVALVRATPRIVEGLIKALPRLMEAFLRDLAKSLPSMIASAIFMGMNAILDKISGGIFGGDSSLGKSGNAFLDLANNAFNTATGGVWGMVTGQGSNPLTSLANTASDAISSAGNAVQNGWNALTGKSVLTPDRSRLGQQSDSGITVIESKLELNQREFGKIILQLSRNNTRLAV